MKIYTKASQEVLNTSRFSAQVCLVAGAIVIWSEEFLEMEGREGCGS